MLPDGLVAGLHERRPAITEDLLLGARDGRGRTPYQWLTEVLPASGPVLDLACGSAPLADLVGAARYLGIDRSDAELREGRRRRPEAPTLAGDVLTTPIGGGPFAAVSVSMALMLLPLEAVLARVAAWLVPGGGLVAIVPSRDPTLAGTAYGRLLAALQLADQPFPEPLAAASLDARCTAAGFLLGADEVTAFNVPIAEPAERERLLASFYTGAGASRTAAAEALSEQLASGARSIPYPIRRLRLTSGAGPSGRRRAAPPPMAR